MAHTQAHTTVEEAIAQQYKTEAADLKHAEDLMLKQKYGLVAPQLTGKENEMIRREAKRAKRDTIAA